MSDVIKSDPNSINDPGDSYVNTTDADPAETQEWLDSLEYVLSSKGPDRAKYLLSVLEAKALMEGVDMPAKSNTAYINTISKENTPPYPGNREIERRLKSFIRWNAMAMVVKANRKTKAPGLGGVGGHISTFASSATLYEVCLLYTSPSPRDRG